MSDVFSSMHAALAALVAWADEIAERRGVDRCRCLIGAGHPPQCAVCRGRRALRSCKRPSGLERPLLLLVRAFEAAVGRCELQDPEDCRLCAARAALKLWYRVGKVRPNHSGRRPLRIGERCRRGHLLTDKTLYYYARTASGKAQRGCRICRRAYGRAWRAGHVPQKRLKGHCLQGLHPLTPENTYTGSDGYPRCKPCHRAACKEGERRRRERARKERAA